MISPYYLMVQSVKSRNDIPMKSPADFWCSAARVKAVTKEQRNPPEHPARLRSPLSKTWGFKLFLGGPQKFVFRKGSKIAKLMVACFKLWEKYRCWRLAFDGISDLSLRSQTTEPVKLMLSNPCVSAISALPQKKHEHPSTMTIIHQLIIHPSINLMRPLKKKQKHRFCPHPRFQWPQWKLFRPRTLRRQFSGPVGARSAAQSGKTSCYGVSLYQMGVS